MWISRWLKLFFLLSLSLVSVPNTNNIKFSQSFLGIVMESLYRASKSDGFCLKMMSQLAFDLILAGIMVYFCVTRMMLIVPLRILCRQLKKSDIVSLSNSCFLISEMTSSRTKSTLRWPVHLSFSLIPVPFRISWPRSTCLSMNCFLCCSSVKIYSLAAS